MRFIIPIILIVIAFGLYFSYIDPTYEKVTELRAEEATFDDALDRSKELIAIRDRLLNTYNTFSRNDLDRIEKLLPNHVDSVRLIIDIDSIAALHGLRVQGISVGTIEEENGGEGLGVVKLGFAVEASYEVLKKFLVALEDSLRLLDVLSISFSSDDGDFTRYNIDIRTYWLK